MNRSSTLEKSRQARGKLKIGDDWNAITIIALSQSSPLKAIAELVENSIDAKARAVTITRGREHGRHYLAIRDDGEGVPRDAQGRPDFRYVATHICDSVKRRMKADGASGLQGEFGIGLLSFWTVGEELTMTSVGTDHHAYQMIMRRGDPSYAVSPRRALFAEAAKVITDPRCVNCHPAGDHPLQGDDGHIHFPAAVRGEAGVGVPGGYCATCHAGRRTIARLSRTCCPAAASRFI